MYIFTHEQTFRARLEEKVIDIEVAAGTSSPTVDPSVRTILIGHSMGGVVAAEVVAGITAERPINYTEDGVEKSEEESSSVPLNSLMFPYIQGVLAFDTPYLGISPGLVAHGAEGHYRDATAAFAQLSQLSGLGASFWGASQSARSPGPAAKTAGALPPPPPAQGSGGGDKYKKDGAADGGGWAKWGKMAMYAGAAGAVAAGGAAAWMNRDQITEGWTYLSSHLEFVNTLARPEEMKKRVSVMVRAGEELGGRLRQPVHAAGERLGGAAARCGGDGAGERPNVLQPAEADGCGALEGGCQRKGKGRDDGAYE